MEKLIELLNEYAKKLGIGDYVGWHNKKTVENSDYIITKKFGFIKWLVDNDKIDLGKTKKLYRKSNEHSVHTYPIMYEYSEYESLLMLLAISDTPIEDLISYLK